MPITPFYFGPGLLANSSMPARFSFLAYALTEVTIDAEVLVRLALDQDRVDGRLHSLGGSILTGVVVGTLLHLAGNNLKKRYWLNERYPMLAPEVALGGTLAGGITSGIGASLLDALMYRTVEPFWPFAAGNNLAGLVSSNAIVIGCVVAGAAGALVLLLRYLPSRNRRQPWGHLKKQGPPADQSPWLDNLGIILAPAFPAHSPSAMRAWTTYQPDLSTVQPSKTMH